jgi:hypothetical protein
MRIILTHISILNSSTEPSDHRRHQYSCGSGRDEDAPEIGTRWVRHKLSAFSSASTPLSRSIRGARKPLALQTRLTIAISGGEVYVIGQAGGR